MSRRPIALVAIPALVLFVWGRSFARWADATSVGVSTSVVLCILVTLWGSTAQFVAGVRNRAAVLQVTLLALVLAVAGTSALQRLEAGWAPFTLAVVLAAAFCLAIPAAAVDGLRPRVLVRNAWSGARGSRVQLAVAWCLLMVVHVAVLGMALFFFIRVPTDAWLIGVVVCVVVGSALGATMTLSSIAYSRLRELQRLGDVSAWVEAFR